jgi:hypothetical protein
MYVCISAQQFVGVVLLVVARQSVLPLCEVRGAAAVPCGIMNTAGNKGGVSCSVSVLDTRIVFVAAHLAGNIAPPFSTCRLPSFKRRSIQFLFCSGPRPRRPPHCRHHHYIWRHAVPSCAVRGCPSCCRRTCCRRRPRLCGARACTCASRRGGRWLQRQRGRRHHGARHRVSPRRSQLQDRGGQG